MQKVAAFIFSGVQSSFSSRLIWDRDLGSGPAGNIFPNVAQPVFYSTQPTVSSVNVRRSRHAEEKEEVEEKENHKTSVRG